jgi:hypothetical protein
MFLKNSFFSSFSHYMFTPQASVTNTKSVFELQITTQMILPTQPFTVRLQTVHAQLVFSDEFNKPAKGPGTVRFLPSFHSPGLPTSLAADYPYWLVYFKLWYGGATAA